MTSGHAHHCTLYDGELMQDTDDFACALPEAARKTVVVQAVGLLAQSMTKKRESKRDKGEDEEESGSSSDKAELGEVVAAGASARAYFDPARDLGKAARKNLLRRLCMTMPAGEVKDMAKSWGERVRKALFLHMFERAGAELLRQGVSQVANEGMLQALAEGLDPKVFGGSHLSYTTCLTHEFFKSREQCNRTDEAVLDK